MSDFYKQPAIFSHRRSGRWFYTMSIAENYEITHHQIYKYHLAPWSFEETHRDVIRKQYPICIHRDGRDVMVSLYYWSRGSGEAVKYNVQYLSQRLSFSDWLRSGPPCYTVDDAKKDESPVEYWARYTREMSKIDSFFHTRYEDLHWSKYDGTSDHPILKKIGEECKLAKRPKIREIHPIARNVGHMPRKKIIGDYKNHFNKDDLEYFAEIAGDVMDELFPEGW